MGLSSKQVSSDGVGWSRSLLQAQTLEIPPKASPMKRQQHLQTHQQQQLEPPLKCPRCDSSNTKFCYYNNHNKSQPRHFCKACKRHWTKGGTLRNVPVGGGGRKNKRLKTSNSKTGGTASTTSTAAIKTSTISGVNNRLKSFMVIQSQQQRQEEHHKLPLADQKNISNMQFQAVRRPSSSSSLLQQNSINCSNLDGKIFSASNGVFLGSSSSTLSLTQTQGLQFPFLFSSSSSSSFDTSQSSISTSFQSSSIYNYSGGETMEDPTTVNNVIMPAATSATDSQRGQVLITSSGIDMANYWNWDDIDALVSTDLNTMPWDDSEIKP